LEERAVPAAMQYFVTNTNDAGVGSFRQALTDHNTNADPGDQIFFQIPNPGGGVQTIHSKRLLDPIKVPVLIDAESKQPGFFFAPVVQLEGSQSFGDCLDIFAGNTRVQGLIISGFSGDGIALIGGERDVVQNCWIGVDSTGTQPDGNATNGISITGSSNTIGGAGFGEGNVISGNGQNGIFLGNTSPTGLCRFNVIDGNYVGTDVNGAGAVANDQAGVLLANDSTFLGSAVSNTIGGLAASAVGNVISGNLGDGVRMTGAKVLNNLVALNYIGVQVGGNAARGNGGSGVYLTLGASNNTVGGALGQAKNVISGNAGDGVTVRRTSRRPRRTTSRSRATSSAWGRTARHRSPTGRTGSGSVSGPTKMRSAVASPVAWAT
jgi:hypothetical protein